MLNIRLTAKDNLIWRGILNMDSTLYSGACGKEEILNHLLFDFDFFGVVWYDVARWLRFFSFIPPLGIILHALQFSSFLCL
jgi:hypothetical protein